MKSEVRVFSYPDGQIQRVQTVSWNDWSRLEFLQPAPSPNAFESFCHVYRKFLVPGCPWMFGQIVLFRLPEGEGLVKVPLQSKRYGSISDPLTAAAVILRSGITLAGGKPVFRTEEAKRLWKQLEKQACLQIVRGKLPHTVIVPVGKAPGYLSQTAQDAEMKVNANFFVMDTFDCATVYDQVGTPIGLCVKNGVVQNPPLFGREALLVRQNGTVTIEAPQLEQLEIEIGGKRYKAGVNAEICMRPHCAKAPNDHRTKLVIVGRTVVAVRQQGSVPVPASGFVLCLDESVSAVAGDEVIYRGMEDILFGIQVGNSILRGGEKTKQFLSSFYNIRKLQPVPYPPSLYPMDFDGARAARIAIGSNAQGEPTVLWAEGAGKLRYIPGEDSCGASLSEMAEMCAAVGMVNAVNLDGGGSAQILLQGERVLHISDRTPQNEDAERPVPMGLMVCAAD